MILLFPAPGGHADGLFCFRRPVGKPMVSLFPAPGGHADGLCSRRLPVVGGPMTRSQRLVGGLMIILGLSNVGMSWKYRVPHKSHVNFICFFRSVTGARKWGSGGF